MVNPAEIRALVLTRDDETVAILSNLFHEIGITVQSYIQETEAARGLESGRFEALVLDFDNIGNTGAVIERLRDSPSNKSTLVFAIARRLHQARWSQHQPFQHPLPFWRRNDVHC